MVDVLLLESLIGKQGEDINTGYKGKITGFFVNDLKRQEFLIESIDTTGRPITQWVDVKRVKIIEES